MLDWRFALVIATARSLPALMCGAAEIVVVNSIVTRPPRTSVTAGGIPLYGTWIMLTPAARWNISAERWGAEPAPGVANVSSPGLAFASAMRSLMELPANEGATTTTFGWKLSCVTGVKSLTGSYGSLGYRPGLIANVVVIISTV